MLYGANRPYNVVLVVPDESAVRRWAKKHDLSIGDISKDPHVLELIMRELRDRSGELKSYEIPKRATTA